MMGLPSYWKMFEALEHSVRTGAAAADVVTPGGAWEYLKEQPEQARIFDEAMIAKAHAQIPGIVGAYDFSRFKSIADIGGGHGHLVRAVLQAVPSAEGILFDLPHVIDEAAPSERLGFQAGNFFEDRLLACDAP
jgi:hypothetical protein